MLNRSPSPPGDPWGGASRSTLIPLLGDRSKFAVLVQKGQLVPAAATILAAVLLIYALQTASVTLFTWTFGLYVTVGFVYFIYQLCGRAMPWWLLAGSGVATMAGIGFAAEGFRKVFGFGLFWPFYVIGDLLGAGLLDPKAGPILQLWGGFVVGLREEAYKALPVLILAYVGLRWRDPRAKLIGVFEPLDGILIGVASGGGFTLAETLNLYIPRVIETDGLAFGLALLLPRILGDLGGHIAYSGYFGYFIGLAVLFPRQAVRFLLLGLGSAAALHGLWDGLPGTVSVLFGTGIAAVTYLAIALVSYGCLAAAILQARKLSPTRAQNFATQITAAPPRIQAPAPLRFDDTSGATQTAYPAPARPSPVSPARPPAPAREAEPATVAASPHRAAPVEVRASTRDLVLTIGPVEQSIRAGVQIGPQTLGSAGAGRGPGPIGEITANPKDPSVLGLRNLSAQPWRVALPSGQTLVVESGRTVRLDAGTTIDFGGVQGRVQVQKAH